MPFDFNNLHVFGVLGDTVPTMRSNFSELRRAEITSSIIATPSTFRSGFSAPAFCHHSACTSTTHYCSYQNIIDTSGADDSDDSTIREERRVISFDAPRTSPDIPPKLLLETYLMSSARTSEIISAAKPA